MERTGSSKQVQGGGDGIGFRPPLQMMRTSPESILKISKESIIRASLKLEEEKRVMEATGNVDEMRKHKMKTWLEVLSSRYFSLRRKHELLRCSGTRNVPIDASDVPRQSSSAVEADVLPQSSSTAANEIPHHSSSSVEAEKTDRGLLVWQNYLERSRKDGSQEFRGRLKKLFICGEWEIQHARKCLYGF